MKTLYMETTKKYPEETSAEIEVLLSSYGLLSYNKLYEGGEVVGCYFVLGIREKEVPIKLPVRWEPLWAMAQRGETRYIKDKKQAQRVAWRQVLRWIESQLALVELEMVEIAEVFLPYMVVSKTTTLYDHMVAHGMQITETAGKEKK